MEFFTFTLNNGIRCILRRTNSPIAYSSITINAGSRDELPGEFGLAHFTEHMLFKGTQRHRASYVNSRLEKYGGELNAFTGKEDTVIHATTLNADLPKAVSLMTELVFESVFPESELLREREVVLDEICSYKDNPQELIYDQFEDILFENSELGHAILGYEREVAAFTRTQVESFVKRCYTADSMVFAVAADITEAEFRSLCNKYLTPVSTGARSMVRKRVGKAVPFNRSIDRGTHQNHCVIGGRAYDVYDDRRMTLALITNILGGPAANSLLNTELREKRGLTYSVEASYTPYTDTGIVSICFGSERDKTESGIAAIMKIIAQMKSRGLGEKLLEQYKKQFVGQLSIAMESMEGYMLSAAKSMLIFSEVDPAKKMCEKVMEVSARDVSQVMNEVFSDLSVLLYNGKTSVSLDM